MDGEPAPARVKPHLFQEQSLNVADHQRRVRDRSLLMVSEYSPEFLDPIGEYDPH